MAHIERYFRAQIIIRTADYATTHKAFEALEKVAFDVSVINRKEPGLSMTYTALTPEKFKLELRSANKDLVLKIAEQIETQVEENELLEQGD